MASRTLDTTSQPSSLPAWREPLRATLLRTGIIALVAGAVIARFWGGMGRWPVATIVALWPSFGGHWVEVWFLNWLRPRIAPSRGVQAAARVGVWFVAGVGLAVLMALTATALTGWRPRHWPAWWIGGVGFIGVELVAHLGLLAGGRPSFYNGRG